ncbi:LysR family transcriptional regulator [Shewanella sp. Scap07]|uniref:LysR family transcriptional regulator n=1 Tax=Shewanella sp. Scap07 TaxID=2589987 RepID=UPI0015BDA5CE|nr:LysR family transcriptional regulator [Shewanella sp. Scap07]QLE87473.1 LysR family transcriptional regulator [Shewanella sp. Scap07]
MNWSIAQLDAFVTTVTEGSFSAAARKLGKAQSRVSTAVANLEIDLGVTLFDRSGKVPELTANGREMFAEAQAVLAQCQRLQSRALTVTSGEEVALNVVIDEAVPLNAFEQVFARLASRFPLLRLSIFNGTQDDIAQWVDEGRADLGILFHVKPLQDSLEFMSIGQFRHHLIVAKDHPLAAIAVPTIKDLSQYRQLVIRDRVGDTQPKALAANHWYVDSYYYITALVSHGVGWALVPDHVATSHWYAGVVSLATEFIPDPLLVEIGVVNRRDQAFGPVMEWLYAEIEQIAKQQQLQA